MSGRSVPFIDAGAVVSGFAAAWLSRVLRDVRSSGEFRAMPPEGQGQVAAAMDAIDSGRRTRGASRRRRFSFLLPFPVVMSEVASPEIGAWSEDEVLSAEEASAVLGVSQRRMRQLGAGGLGRKAGGRWVFGRDVIEAEVERTRRIRVS